MQNFSTQKIPYIIHKQFYLFCPKLANQIDANLIEKQNSWYQFHMLVINLTRSLKNNPFNFDLAFSFLLFDGTEYYNKKAFFTFLVEKFEFCALYSTILIPKKYWEETGPRQVRIWGKATAEGNIHSQMNFRTIYYGLQSIFSLLILASWFLWFDYYRI